MLNHSSFFWKYGGRVSWWVLWVLECNITMVGTFYGALAGLDSGTMLASCSSVVNPCPISWTPTVFQYLSNLMSTHCDEQWCSPKQLLYSIQKQSWTHTHTLSLCVCVCVFGQSLSNLMSTNCIQYLAWLEHLAIVEIAGYPWSLTVFPFCGSLVHYLYPLEGQSLCTDCRQ